MKGKSKVLPIKLQTSNFKNKSEVKLFKPKILSWAFFCKTKMKKKKKKKEKGVGVKRPAFGLYG